LRCNPDAFFFLCNNSLLKHSSHVFLARADLEEVGKLLGITGCPQCLVKNDKYKDFDHHAPARRMKEAKALVTTARRMLLERGNVTAAKDLLKEHRLSTVHTKIWNPFFFLPHCDYDCFPQDYLHGM
jgi:hypothetical protein